MVTPSRPSQIDDFNLYAYVYNDPMNLMDPTGEKLVFEPNSTAAFKKQFGEIIKYHNKHGTAGVFARLEKLPAIITIKEGTNHTFEYQGGSDTIVVDPTSGLELAPGSVQTPALGALHEAAHAEKEVTNQQQFNTDKSTYDPNYDDKEEADVIQNSETPAAQKIGEPTRQNHGGTPVIVKCPTCDK